MRCLPHSVVRVTLGADVRALGWGKGWGCGTLTTHRDSISDQPSRMRARSPTECTSGRMNKRTFFAHLKAWGKTDS